MATSLLAAAGSMSGGCHWLINGLLDPGLVGDYQRHRTLEIRNLLSVEDVDRGVPGATEPSREDLIPYSEEYRIAPGDVVTVRMYEIIERTVETVVQPEVNERGFINLPVLGWIHVTGMTERELHSEIVDMIRERELIRDPQVQVTLALRRGQTFNIFGVVQAPSTYVITRPDFRLLEALSAAGGLNDLVTKILIFRQEPSRPEDHDDSEVPTTAPGRPDPAGSPSWMGDGFAMNRSAPPDNEEDAAKLAAQDNAQTPPSQDAKAELIESVSPAQPKTTAPATTAQTEPSEAAEPPGRWIFLNGKWIEMKGSAPPQPEVKPQEPVGALPTRPSQPVRDAYTWDMPTEEEQRVIEIPADLLRDGDPRYNIIVRSRDTIRVVAGETGDYYVMGQIARPGAYSLTGRKITFKIAIAAAGGFGPLAWPAQCLIIRRQGNREEMIPINGEAVFEGRTPDFYLKGDDIVMVGSSPITPFLATVRSAFRVSYGFGFVYDRNFGDIDAYGGKINPSITRRQDRQARFPGLFP